MEHLPKTLLRALARENEVAGWPRMTKPQLIEALEDLNITLEDLTVPDLKSAAKSRGIKGFHKMRKEELVKALTTSNIPGLSNLTFKVLKAIAQEHGVNVTSKTTEAELVDALKNIDIFLDNLRNTERKYLAKVRGIRGYNKMRREELIKALSAFIPEVKLPIPEVRTPHSKLSFTSLKRLVKKVEDSVVTDVDKFTEWILEQIPDPVKKRATHNVNALNKKVKGLFKEIERFKPRELESAFNIFLNTYRIQ